jgi:hypothetical protein
LVQATPRYPSRPEGRKNCVAVVEERDPAVGFMFDSLNADIVRGFDDPARFAMLPANCMVLGLRRAAWGRSASHAGHPITDADLPRPCVAA